MKKLMIAAAMVCAAALGQAADFNWKISGTGYICAPGTEDGLTATTPIYLFVGLTDTDKGNIVTAFNDGKLDLASMSAIQSDTGLDEGVLANGTVAASYGTFGVDYDFDTIFVTKVDGVDYLYISDAVTVAGKDGKAQTVTFKEFDNSSAAVMDASAGYSSAGWYTAVPEPTSGLLLLLGVAGLALRRRRA